MERKEGGGGRGIERYNCTYISSALFPLSIDKIDISYHSIADLGAPMTIALRWLALVYRGSLYWIFGIWGNTGEFFEDGIE